LIQEISKRKTTYSVTITRKRSRRHCRSEWFLEINMANLWPVV